MTNLFRSALAVLLVACTAQARPPLVVPGGGGGGGAAVPQFSIDFQSIGTHTKNSTGAWGGVTELPSLNLNTLGGDNTQADIDSNGLGGNGTTGVIAVDFDLLDLDADLDLTDGGIYAFLMEHSADPNAGAPTAEMRIGSDVLSGDLNFPQFAGMVRETSISRVKYFQGRGGAFISDHIDTVSGTTVDVSALGLIITNQQGTGYYQGDPAYSAPGQIYPARLNNNGNPPMQNAMGVGAFVYNAAGSDTRIYLGVWATVYCTRFTVWRVDANLITP